jgi:hypothetical protein
MLYPNLNIEDIEGYYQSYTIVIPTKLTPTAKHLQRSSLVAFENSGRRHSREVSGTRSKHTKELGGKHRHIWG